MRYVEMTVDEAIKVLKKSKGKKVMMAVHDLTCEDINNSFYSISKNECNRIIENAETVASMFDDFVKSLRVFTEKQDIPDIRPIGLERIILLKE